MMGACHASDVLEEKNTISTGITLGIMMVYNFNFTKMQVGVYYTLVDFDKKKLNVKKILPTAVILKNDGWTDNDIIVQTIAIPHCRFSETYALDLKSNEKYRADPSLYYAHAKISRNDHRSGAIFSQIEFKDIEKKCSKCYLPTDFKYLEKKQLMRSNRKRSKN